MTVYYEWDAETWRDDEIYDHNHNDTIRHLLPLSSDEKLVLVRNVGNQEDGILERTWAYVEDGILPEFFDDGHRVPKRFHDEFKSAYNKR